MRTLHYGDRGEDVISVQKRLYELGYLSNANYSGVMDDETVVTIIRYQRASGIFPNNGQVAEGTMRALKLVDN